MQSNGYGIMQLIRLSPQNGKALRLLNVIQGQILHGKIYKVESLIPGQKPVEGSTLLAKIALGSSLIEALLDSPIPEGSRVSLEVVKITDDNFTLKLLSVEPPTEQTQGIITDSKNADIIELSNGTIVSVSQQKADPIQATEAKIADPIIELTDLAALPKPIVKAIRASIAEGFINRENLSARPQVAATGVKTELDEFIGLINQAAKSIKNLPNEYSEIIRSIIDLSETIKPVIAGISAQEPGLGESAENIVKALTILSDAFETKPIQNSTNTGTTDANRAAALSKDSIALSEKPVDINAANKSDTTDITKNALPNRQGTVNEGIAGERETSKPVIESPVSGIKADGGGAEKTIIQAQNKLPSVLGPESQSGSKSVLQAENETIKLAGEQLPSDSAVLKSDVNTAGSQSEIAANDSRDTVLALRILSMLSNRLAQSLQLSTEQAASVSQHAARISWLADAWDGMSLMPLISQAREIPDAVPRMFFDFNLPGGSAEVGILQPGKSGKDSSGDAKQEQGAISDRDRFFGLIRFKTEALGELRIRLDYFNDGSDSKAGGQFISNSEIARSITSLLPKLNSALEARGIKSSGFKIIARKESSETGNASPVSKKNSGGLDIKI